MLNKMVSPDVLRCRFVIRYRTEILKTYSESLFQGGSGHVFNFFLRPSRAEKTRLESRRTDPRGFAVVETGFYRGKTYRIRSTTF